MATDDDDTAVEFLQPLLEELAAHSPPLAGAYVKRWYLVTEHEFPDGGLTLSRFYSDRQSPWDRMGLLHFATVMEDAAAADRDWEGDAEDD